MPKQLTFEALAMRIIGQSGRIARLQARHKRDIERLKKVMNAADIKYTTLRSGHRIDLSGTPGRVIVIPPTPKPEKL